MASCPKVELTPENKNYLEFCRRILDKFSRLLKLYQSMYNAL